MSKPKIAFIDLTGCEGCEFHLLSLNEELHRFFQDFDITHWRLMTDSVPRDFDIAFIEGAVTTREHLALVKQVRQTAHTVVAIGACAITGNVFAGLNPNERRQAAQKIYGPDHHLKAEFFDPVEKHIKVDFKIPGCPPDLDVFQKFLTVFKNQDTSSPVLKVAAPDYVSKIEGHGSLRINFSEKKASFQIEESERLVEGLLLGKPYSQAPFVNARICGICPVAHSLCSWKAIEAALSVEPAPATVVLREIMLTSQIVKSHLLHLFFLVLPDYAGLTGSLDLSARYPAEFHLMLTIKRVSERALALVAGSSIFPTNLGLAGFQKIPDIEALLAVRDEINQVTDEARDLISLFADFPVAIIESRVATLATTPPPGRYPLYQSTSIPQVGEQIQSGSTAKLGFINGEIVKVGALARLSHYADRLNPMAAKALAAHPFEITNPYNNNLAQAIEILHYLEEMRSLVESLVGKDLSAVSSKDPKAKQRLRVDHPQSAHPSREASEELSKASGDKPVSSGVEKPTTYSGRATLEAPRGVLIHEVKLDTDGRIVDYNIIPPTQINLASLEVEAQLVLRERGQGEREIRREIEKLIRAFDPCITCAVH